jgi:transposase-like protein
MTEKKKQKGKSSPLSKSPYVRRSQKENRMACKKCRKTFALNFQMDNSGKNEKIDKK